MGSDKAKGRQAAGVTGAVEPDEAEGCRAAGVVEAVGYREAGAT